MNDELPKGWAVSTVGECFLEVRNGTTSPQNKTGAGIPISRIETIQESKFDLNRVGSISNLTPEVISAYRYQPGDIAFSHINSFEHVGKSALYQGIPEVLIHGMNLLRLRLCHTCIEPKFAYLFMQSAFFRDGVRQRVGHAVNQVSINQRNLASVPLILAPLREQHRIVAKLEKLLDKVDSCQKRLAKIPILLKRFRQAVLAVACSGRLTADWREEHVNVENAETILQTMQGERRRRWVSANKSRKYVEPERLSEDDLPEIPATWIWTNFDHCSWEITVGHVGPMKDRYVNSGISFLRSQNVRPLRFDSEGLVFIPSDFHAALRKSCLHGGEILVTRSGANTGDCCVFPSGIGEANCADLVITRPLSLLCAEYAAIYVCSPIGQARLSLKETGIAQPHFNIGAMRTKAFPLPPFPEQQEIVRRVKALLVLVCEIEARYSNSKDNIDKLKQSILAKAFRGELVPQDPNDEPASTLLERICEARGIKLRLSGEAQSQG